MSRGTRLVLGLLHVHQALYERSDGRIGHRLIGVHCLLLGTTGRRSGRRRTTALAYARDGGTYVVVGSLGGADVAPAWLHNVRAEPAVAVQVGRRRFPATARVVERSDADHAHLWALVNAESGGRYDRYQAKTARPIPVVVLGIAQSVAPIGYAHGAKRDDDAPGPHRTARRDRQDRRPAGHEHARGGE